MTRLTPQEIAAIQAYTGPIQIIPRGVSSLPQYRWDGWCLVAVDRIPSQAARMTLSAIKRLPSRFTTWDFARACDLYYTTALARLATALMHGFVRPIHGGWARA